MNKERKTVIRKREEIGEDGEEAANKGEGFLLIFRLLRCGVLSCVVVVENSR